MIVVETTVWIDYLNGRSTRETNWLDQNVSLRRVALFDLILCEVLQGIRDERDFRDAHQELLRFNVLPTGGVELAVASARNYRTLRKKGVTIRTTVDCLIATACIDGGHQLLHNDRDYDPFEQHLNLAVVHS